MSSSESPESKSSAEEKPLTLGVLIVTFRRVGYLKSCLAALLEQTRCPDKIWVVYRAQDDVSRKFLEQFSKEYPLVQPLPHYAGGAVAGINRALVERLETDIVCMTHDNAVAAPDWLAQTEAFYRTNPTAGAVGGRDILYQHGQPLPVEDVSQIGVLTPMGELVGNHHQNTPDRLPRPVHYLKGANMSFRRELLPDQLDTRLLGSCSHYEVDLCFHVRRQGAEVYFLPTLTVQHNLEAPGFEDPVSDERAIVRDRTTAYLHNRMLVISKYGRGLNRYWLLLTQLLWHLPVYVLGKKHWTEFLAEFPILHRAAWMGWAQGRKKPSPVYSRLPLEPTVVTHDMAQTSLG